jgi:hypothetical protein
MNKNQTTPMARIYRYHDSAVLQTVPVNTRQTQNKKPLKEKSGFFDESSVYF